MSTSDNQKYCFSDTYDLRHALYDQRGSNSGIPHYYLIDYSSGQATVITREPTNSTTTAQFCGNTASLSSKTGEPVTFTPPTTTLDV